MLCTAERAHSGSSCLNRLAEWINGDDRVEWYTVAEMAEEFKAGRIAKSLLGQGDGDICALTL